MDPGSGAGMTGGSEAGMTGGWDDEIKDDDRSGVKSKSR
jgi:hypothetical protein